MSVLMYLIPIALLLGLIWLGAFIWSIKSGQYDDLEGAAIRILMEDDGGPQKMPEKNSVKSEKQ
ncbi:MAG: cbb3-type cytochrome oxidase assembly protein CcoS [Alphaproteobacteria bacterium]|nr:cbb3-type cytochrome oxidase assembly protein CcoS [Alphaproteobacteria bacterium]MBP7758644.1 cbb3-type cytochrome oxidase assembly protein CcoS [Alphaproteobacteria bacterium]MBP7761672.1 cbb3-type cytochrome oxidase assembly protein CcoS [Alphaproteobacteria bacterium]MBP7906219.1 cbb3-type cytochrome oxidase assembly protein CcoS [Alphaproteobacteria bacterium]